MAKKAKAAKEATTGEKAAGCGCLAALVLAVWIIVAAWLAPSTPQKSAAPAASEAATATDPPATPNPFPFGGYLTSDTRSYEAYEHCGGDSDDQAQQAADGLTLMLHVGQHVHVSEASDDGRFYTVQVGDWKGCVPQDVVTRKKPDPTPPPETYEQQRQREKREFIQGVDESISGTAIAGNKFKYVGHHVDLHCTVSDIPDRSFFNATCGEDGDGVPVTIVIQTSDTSDLAQGQAVRILGTVQEPSQGTNAYGGALEFPTVKAEYME